MNKEFDIVALTKGDWRDLGFFYIYDKEQTTWKLIGSREGLANFSERLREYARDGRNKDLGEHDHLGPYSHLTIVTSESPQITDYGIFGSIDDLNRLANLAEERIGKSHIGDTIQIGPEYSSTNEASLLIEIRDDGFDPSQADDFAWVKK